MSEPRADVIERTGRNTASRRSNDGAVDWAEVEQRLRAGEGTSWLGVRGRGGGVHTRPLFAAWTGSGFAFATKAGAAKTRHLEADGRVSLAVDLGTWHLVAEGTATRLTDAEGLERVRTAMREVFDWPTEVVGAELDAPYAAPTSGGPPFQAWEILPETVIVLPTADQAEPTRFTFG